MFLTSSDIVWYLSFLVWLTSLRVITYGSIHAAADRIVLSFAWLSSIPLCVCVYVCISHLLYPFIETSSLNT